MELSDHAAAAPICGPVAGKPTSVEKEAKRIEDQLSLAYNCTYQSHLLHIPHVSCLIVITSQHAKAPDRDRQSRRQRAAVRQTEDRLRDDQSDQPCDMWTLHGKKSGK